MGGLHLIRLSFSNLHETDDLRHQRTPQFPQHIGSQYVYTQDNNQGPPLLGLCSSAYHPRRQPRNRIVHTTHSFGNTRDNATLLAPSRKRRCQ